MKELQQYKQDLLSAGIPETILNRCFIAGGAIRSLILGEKVKDVDVFCEDEETLKTIESVVRFGIFPIFHIASGDVSVCGISENAITFTLKGTQFQIIKVKTGSPMDVIGEFDFIMNMNYYHFLTNETYIESLYVIKDKRLEINPKCRNKLGTLARLEKFLNRGYKIGSRKGLLELGTQISKLEPIDTFTKLENESKLYITFEEYEEIDFVEKDSGSIFVAKYVGSAF